MPKVEGGPSGEVRAVEHHVLVEDLQPALPAGRAWRGRLELGRFAGLFLIIVLFAVYSVTEGDKFDASSNIRTVLSSNAITGILALGLVISLICGAFDLSVGANMSWSVIFVGWLQANAHLPWGLALTVTLLSGALIGAANAFVALALHIDSVIGTLAMQSLLAGLTYWLTNGQEVSSGISSTFTELGSGVLFGIPLPVYYFVGLGLILYYVLDHTPGGRYLYAVGANPTASRLAGLRINRVQASGLIASATIASLAGLIFTAQIGSSATDAGTPYLLPGFAAAFLGATQIKRGRFNVWGTFVAIYLLTIGLNGLVLHFPSDPWLNDVFEGGVLIVAVGFSVRSLGRRAHHA